MKAVRIVGRFLYCASAAFLVLVPGHAPGKSDVSVVESRPTVVIVELKSNGGWPIPRSKIAELAAVALESGAIAVGLDIHMSMPTTDREDAVLAALLKKDRRVVPLLFDGRGNSADPEGFVMGADGKLRGVKCDSAETSHTEAFAVRLAIAAGQTRDNIYRHCINAELQPSTWSAALQVTVVPVSHIGRKSSRDVLSGAVAIFGTADPMLGTPTPAGVLSTAVINAHLVRSALTLSSLSRK